jgi:hypothetical protein
MLNNIVFLVDKFMIPKFSKEVHLKIFFLTLFIGVPISINCFAFSVEKHKSSDGKFRGVCNDGYVFMDSWHVYKDVVLNGMKDCKNHGGFTATPQPRDVSGVFSRPDVKGKNLRNE